MTDSPAPTPTPIPAPTTAQDRSDDATGAVTALRIGAATGAVLTAAQAQEVLKALAGTAAIATHAARLEELVASYGGDMNAISVSLGAARDAISSRMILPIAYEFDKAAKARTDLADQLKSNGSITAILAAAVRVATAFV